MRQKFETEVTISNREDDLKSFEGRLHEVEHFFNKTQIIPHIGETLTFNTENLEIAVSSESKDGEHSGKIIHANLNALYAIVTSVQYDTRGFKIRIGLIPDGIGYEPL